MSLTADVAAAGVRVGASRSAMSPFDSLGRLLTRNQRFRTSDPARAESEMGQLTAPHRLEVRGEESAFDAVLSAAGFGNISLYLLRYGPEVTIHGPAQSRYFTVLIPLTGTIEGAHQGEEFIAMPGRTHVVLSEGDRFHMGWSENCAVIILRADSEALRAMLSGMLPDVGVDTLRFTTRVESDNARAAVESAIWLLMSSLTTEGLAPPPIMRRHLCQHVLSTVVFGLEHNYSAALRLPPPAISNRAVRHAIDVINAEEAAQFTVGDIAREVGIGLRALEIGFKKHIDISPSQYLKNARMHRARTDLLAADTRDGATVARIAMTWGFSHAGRFSQAYRAEFGESPVATLRRSSS